MLSQAQLNQIKLAKDQLPEDILAKLATLIAEREKLETTAHAKNDFMGFTNYVWPNFIHGAHHAKMAAAFERVARGECKRLIINMPPRHTKSEFASYLLPAWFLGNFPGKKVIQSSHTAELAVGFGRKVRNLVDSALYTDVFKGISLQSDSKAAGRWATNKGGDYFAIGVGGLMTGKGADLLIIDDPHSEQEATLAESDPAIYDKTYDWYTSGPRQRLQPGGAIVIVMCMTGDTLVLMADGTQKQLRDIRPEDIVATFDGGKLSSNKVNHWQSSGVDSIYKIQTQSGKILRANERHPFLVMNEGVLEWTRLNQLRPGDLLVSLKDATGHHEQKQSRENVGHAKQSIVTTANTQTRQEDRRGIMGNGQMSGVVRKGVARMCQAAGCAPHTMVNNTLPNHQRMQTASAASNTGMGSLLSSTKQWLKSAVTYVTFAVNRPQAAIQERIGMKSSALTIAMILARSEGCSAMTATLPLGMERHQTYLNELHRISDFTVDPIVSITPDGEQEVFDVEIDRTENFIANGVVSHNTRWSKKDLTGALLKAAAQRNGDEWEVIEFPAILPSGRPLWPEFWSLKELSALKTELPNGKWMAQYMQNPTSDISAIVKREWWKIWEHDDPPFCEFTIQSWDTAFLKHERADYSACTTWGVFYKPDDTGVNQAHIILLNSFKRRMEFPELKQVAYEQYKEWDPDSLIVEAKAAGSPLIFELRSMGVPVQEYTPSKGNDKIARLNSVADIFASGRIWVPNKQWAEELVEEVASFPSGEHDDLVDSMTQAILRFRRGGFIRLDTDYEDEPDYSRRRKTVGYY